MTCRVLCTGDLHIGRRASRVPGIYRTADAWSEIVTIAIDEDVDLVALSGDVIDQANSAYEAVGPFQEGLRRLDAEGIQTVAVAGNHDFEALPRIASTVDSNGFRFLGSGGSWEQQQIEIDGVPAISVIGWSFPTEHVHMDPLTSLKEVSSNGLPVLGLLHADVGATRSAFAPVHAERLWTHDASFWLLGHIHVPRQISGPAGRTALYPGSPWAMDPGESGVHGVWIVEFAPGQPALVEHLHTSPVRYISEVLDVSDVDDETGFLKIITAKLEEIGEASLRSDNRSRLQHVSCRLHLYGTTTAYRMFPAWAERAASDLRHRADSRVDLTIERITCDIRPPVDLVQLSNGNDPVAETAALLMALSNDSLVSPYAELVERTQRTMTTIYEDPGYSALLSEDREAVVVAPSDQNARALLTERGWQLMTALLAQKEEA